MGGDRLGDIESRAGYAWYVNRKETHWRQCDIVVERRSEGCDKSQERGQEEVGNISKAGRERHLQGSKQEGKDRSSKIECAGNGRGVLKELQTLKGEHNIYRIGKARDKSTKDFMKWFYGNRISWNGGLIATGGGGGAVIRLGYRASVDEKHEIDR